MYCETLETSNIRRCCCIHPSLHGATIISLQPWHWVKPTFVQIALNVQVILWRKLQHHLTISDHSLVEHFIYDCVIFKGESWRDLPIFTHTMLRLLAWRSVHLANCMLTRRQESIKNYVVSGEMCSSKIQALTNAPWLWISNTTHNIVKLNSTWSEWTHFPTFFELPYAEDP